MYLLNISSKYYMFFMALCFGILLSGFSYYDNSSFCNDNSKLKTWEKEQIIQAYERAILLDTFFIGLGIGKGNDWDSANENAKVESEYDLPERIEIFVKTINTVYTEAINNNKELSVNQDFMNFILMQSSIHINPAYIDYEELGRIKCNGKYYISILSLVNRDEFYSDHFQLVDNSKTKVETGLIKSANKRYRQILNKEDYGN